MYIKIGDLKLLKIKVMQNDNVIYDGMVEDAPEEIKEINYKTAVFQSDYIIIEI